MAISEAFAASSTKSLISCMVARYTVASRMVDRDMPKKGREEKDGGEGTRSHDGLRKKGCEGGRR